MAQKIPALDDEVRDDKGDKIAECGMGSFTDWQARDNARFILEAANNWDALIDTCEKLLKVAEFYGDKKNVNAMCNGTGDDFEEIDGIFHGGKFARETIKKLNGRVK